MESEKGKLEKKQEKIKDRHRNKHSVEEQEKIRETERNISCCLKDRKAWKHSDV
jgi:hypothetical protein